MEQGTEIPEVVFFGSSRTGGGVRVHEMNALLAAEFPADPPRVLNAAAPGGDPITAEFMLDLLTKRGVRPEVVVLEVWPEAFNRRNPFVSLHAVRQFDWDDVPTATADIVRSRASWLFLQARLVPVYTHRKQILADRKGAVPVTTGIKSTGPVAASARPPDPGPLDWEDINRNGPTGEITRATSERQVAVDVRKWLTPFNMSGSGMEPSSILARCRREAVGHPGNPPNVHDPRNEYTPEIESQFLAYIDRLCAEYGCRFSDGREWVPDALFRDLLHVVPDGGTLYTRQFTETALIPVLKARP